MKYLRFIIAFGILVIIPTAFAERQKPLLFCSIHCACTYRDTNNYQYAFMAGSHVACLLNQQDLAQPVIELCIPDCQKLVQTAVVDIRSSTIFCRAVDMCPKKE
ncbi:MAG: hypothetical protein HY537_16435 [Deltaproteobacteria bacterium]|nr:hypothetical protein [Deltaproteobacteria bacterium]